MNLCCRKNCTHPRWIPWFLCEEHLREFVVSIAIANEQQAIRIKLKQELLDAQPEKKKALATAA